MYLSGERIMPESGKSHRRIYLPPEFNNRRMHAFIKNYFDPDGDGLMKDAIVDSTPLAEEHIAKGEFFRHTTHLFVHSAFRGGDGTWRPAYAMWVYYPDGAIDDVIDASIEDVAEGMLASHSDGDLESSGD